MNLIQIKSIAIEQAREFALKALCKAGLPNRVALQLMNTKEMQDWLRASVAEKLKQVKE